MTGERRLRLASFKPRVKGTLRGFADVDIPLGSGWLTIRECPVNVSAGHPWAGFPGKPQIDEGGHHRRDDRGKPAYTAILEMRPAKLREQFSQRVIELVRADHPAALDPEGGA